MTQISEKSALFILSLTRFATNLVIVFNLNIAITFFKVIVFFESIIATPAASAVISTGGRSREVQSFSILVRPCVVCTGCFNVCCVISEGNLFSAKSSGRAPLTFAWIPADAFINGCHLRTVATRCKFFWSDIKIQRLGSHTIGSYL